jgi:hypothetical protein
MKLRLRFGLVLLIGCAALAQLQEPTRAPLRLESPLQDKNFYLFSLMERSPGVRSALKKNSVLARIAAGRTAALNEVSSSCKTEVDCSAAFLWSDEQLAEVSQALAALYRQSPDVRAWADGELRASGAYLPDTGGPELLQHAWTASIRGVNRVIDVYGQGKAPRYPAIDSVTYDPKSQSYRRVIQSAVAILADDREGADLFFEPSLRFALELLLLNHRDEAARYEPMETGENHAAYARIQALDWNRYPYSAIVVPGAGNDRPGVRLSPSGMLRDEIAARRFHQGKAPFLIVSGGYVHPAQTEFSEAIEMKRDLMARLGVPPDAILVDPQARHTTTNMRNAARLIYRYGMPFDKKALVTTDPNQSRYMETRTLETRCVEELGYCPYKLLRRTSAFDLEFLPLVESLRLDPQDPLDP